MRQVRDIYKDIPPVPPQPLLSIEPLFAKLLREEQLADTEHLVTHLATAINRERKSIHRWLEYGITLYHAENLANQLGLHPSYIWGPEYHIASYMEEIRKQITDNNRSKKLSIRRSIRNKENREKKKLEAANKKQK